MIYLNRISQKLRDKAQNGLKYNKVDMKNSKLLMVNNSSFSIDVCYQIKLGYLIIITEDQENLNIIQYSSFHWIPVTLDVFDAEVQNFSIEFGHFFRVEKLAAEILRKLWMVQAYFFYSNKRFKVLDWDEENKKTSPNWYFFIEWGTQKGMLGENELNMWTNKPGRPIY